MATTTLRILSLALCLCVLALIPLRSHAANSRDSRGNLQFDPDADNTAECGIPAHQNTSHYFEPTEGLCASTAASLDSLTENQIHELAVAYAPVLFFHPLEKYTLSSVNYTLEDPTGGRIFRQTKEDSEPYLVDATLNASFLLETSRDAIYALNPNSFYFETDRAYEMYDSPPEARFGSGYDRNGLSKAPLYYNVYESGYSTLTFNYWLYFPYNGEGNMGVLSVHNGTTRYTAFSLKPYGTHEGDWESINVMVCAPPDTSMDPSPPLAIKYHQHEWSELKDCTQGECNFYRDTYHPVGFTALHTHATYSQSVAELVYTEIKVGFFYNLQAFVVVDRSVYKKDDGTYNWYMPSANNLERFQDPYTLDTNDPSYFWQGYGGRWGHSHPTKVEPQPPLCLNPNQTDYMACPTPEEDPVFDLAMQLFAVSPAKSGFTDVIQSVTSQLVNIFSQTKKAPIGPGTKGFWERWIPPRNAPFWEIVDNTTLTSQDFCRAKMQTANDTYREPIPETKAGLGRDLTSLIILTVVITVLNMIIPLVFLHWRDHHESYQPILFNEHNNHPRDPAERSPFGYMKGAIVFSLFFIIMVVAGGVFLGSCDTLFHLLMHWVPGVEWDFVFVVLRVLASVIITINSILLAFLWLQVLEMKHMIQGTYQQLVQQRHTVEGEQLALAFRGDFQYVPWNPKWVDGFFRCSFALLFLSLLFSLICFLVGILAVGVSFAVINACNTVAGALDGVCLDLTVFGIPQVACGDDFRELCMDWNRVFESDGLLFSGFFAFVSHFYLVAATAWSAQQRRSIPALLAQYNLVAAIAAQSAGPAEEEGRAKLDGESEQEQPVPLNQEANTGPE